MADYVLVTRSNYIYRGSDGIPYVCGSKHEAATRAKEEQLSDWKAVEINPTFADGLRNDPPTILTDEQGPISLWKLVEQQFPTLQT